MPNDQTTCPQPRDPYPNAQGDCDRCDGQHSSPKTYRNMVNIPVNGRVECVDHCIHRIVAALNAGGVVTRGTCCGHGEMIGRIDLWDGRVLFLPRNKEEQDQLLKEWQLSEHKKHPLTRE